MTTEDTASTEEFNGWPNRETWAASLHLSNDYGLYEMVNACAIDARGEAEIEAIEDPFGWYSEGFETIERATVRRLAAKLADYIFEIRSELIIACDDGRIEEVAGAEALMVLEIGSDWRVDWQQVAENWLEDFEFEGEES